MDKIPEEILAHILGYLISFKDCQRASKTCQRWERTMQGTTKLWKFGETLPFILQYITTNDLLQCRSVCAHWRSGVDYFLENNAYQRPSFEECTTSGSYKTDFPLINLGNQLQMKNLLAQFAGMSVSMTGNKLQKACKRPSLTIFGRSVYIFENVKSMYVQRKKDFLRTFGSQIWFLTIHIVGLPAVKSVKRAMNYISFMPHLKRLDMTVRIVEGRNSVTPEIIETGLSAYARKYVFAKGNLGLPKLETLHLDVQGICHNEFKLAVLKLLIVSTIQSLSLNYSSDAMCLFTRNIVDVDLSIENPDALLAIPHIDSPMRRLALRFSCIRFQSELVFGAVTTFKATLRNLTLSWIQININEDLSIDDLKSLYELYSKRDTLLDFPQLKRVVVVAVPPISLNFLCGLGRSLEYLSINVIELTFLSGYFQEIINKMQFNEELDIVSLPESYRTLGKESVYSSNVWNVFPKLRAITLSWQGNCGSSPVELNFRKDVRR